MSKHTPDSRLVEAAPDLLAALERVIPDCAQNIADIGGCDHSVGICCCDLIENLAKARAAIAKAKGEA